MRKRTFAAVASVAGGLGIAAAVAASAVTGEALGALPVPTVTLTTPVATATVAVPPPPPVTTAVPLPPPPVTTTVTLPPPPPPVVTVVSAVTTAVAPVTTTATGVVGAVGGSTPSAPSAPSAPVSAPTAFSESVAAGPTAAGTSTTAAVPTGAAVRAAPTLRARRQPGRADARRLVLTLRRPRELTVLFRGPGDTCRVAGRLVVHGRRGTNVVPLNGRVHGGRLAAGVFRVEVVDTTGSVPRVLGKLAVSLRYDADGRPRVRQVRYVPRDCAFGAAALVGSVPVAGERATTSGPSAADAGKGAVLPAESDDPVAVDGDDDGGLAALPKLGPDAVSGIAAVILVALLALSAGAFLLVAGTSALRSLRR